MSGGQNGRTGRHGRIGGNLGFWRVFTLGCALAVGTAAVVGEVSVTVESTVAGAAAIEEIATAGSAVTGVAGVDVQGEEIGTAGAVVVDLVPAGAAMMGVLVVTFDKDSVEAETASSDLEVWLAWSLA